MLFINNGDGRFSKADDKTHFLNENGKEIGLKRDWLLTAKFQELNGDGLPDLYVCNDFWTPDRIWINQGKGIFKEISKNTVSSLSFSSMAVDFSDINRDGALDFFVTEMMGPHHKDRLRHSVTYPPEPSAKQQFDAPPQYMRNMLYLNRGDNTYAEIAYFSNTEATGWSWATRFMGVDLDGYEDLIITTGNAFDVQDLDTQEQLNQQNYNSQEAMKGYILEYPPLHLTNVALRNNRDLTFSDYSSQWDLPKRYF